VVVVTVVEDGRAASDDLARAREYLVEHGIEPTCIEKRGQVGEIILGAVRRHGSELIVVGGYGSSPVVEIVLGSTVDRVLRQSQTPVLICR
jgi:nucleotide-binding universal stress UspA family protein